jgi:formylmethanofuran dehydrogenase subunit E
MSAYITDDPVADFNRRDKEQQEWEDKLPKCARCKEPQDTYVFEIDGELLCLGCVEKKYRRDVEDYLR